MFSLASSVFGSGSDSPDDTPTKQPPGNSTTSTDEEDLCLESRFPSVSKAELDRFRERFCEDNDECIRMIEDRIQFLEMYNLGSPEFEKAAAENDDRADWEWASNTAIEAAKTKPELIPGIENIVALDARFCELDAIPQNCFCHKNEDGSPTVTKDGMPFVQHISAMMNFTETSGASPEVYVTAIALYLERKAKSIGFEKGIVFMIDTRQGTGWENHGPLKVVPFIRIFANTMDKLHPGREAKVVVYPVPYACVYIFTMLKGWLPASIAESVELLDGSDGAEVPPPEELLKILDEDLVETMEETRRARYIA